MLFFFVLPTTDSAAQSSKAGFDEALYDAVQWRSIGPYRGGRSCAVTGVPGKPNLFYFGGAGGGVWRTKDGGQSWSNISDGFFGGSIGSVAVSAYDNNVIYVGGGEKTVRGNVSYGYGIWKTVDAGKTWTKAGLPNSRHVSRIRIHPQNPEVVYAAVMGDLFQSSEERGVYKSEDGGKNWTKVLYVNKDAGAVDLMMDPNNPRILFASTWRVRRTPYSLESGGEGSGLWKSTDGGESWTNISSNEGLPEGTWGINGVTISGANSERIWAIVENENGGVFRSEDGGETWNKVNDKRALRQRAWYYTRIYADPNDEDVVYVVNVDYHKSTDGGKTFKSARAPHGDHHDLWIAPEDSGRMIIGDDGGAQVSFDGGENWSTYQNQPTSQFYRVTTDNNFPYRIYGAQQDNSTVRILHRTSSNVIDQRHWEATAGGESAHIAIDPLDNDIVYGGSYGGFLTRKNHKTGETQAINVWPDNPMGYGAEGMKYRFQWNFPVFFSPHNPKRLFTASNHLHMTEDGGQSWTIVSPDLTRNDPSKLVSSGGPITKDNTGVEYYCTIFAACESPYEKDLFWVGSDDGLLHVSKDGGKNWDNVTPKGMPEWMMINSIDPDPFVKGGAYVAGTRYKLGDYQPYLYHTADYGKTWKKIVNGIPKDHFTRVLRADPKRKGLLYAGTETGMYISFDNGSNWQSFQLNLPTVPVTDLAIKNDNLIAATQGRSFWVIDDLTVIHQLNKKMAKNDHHLFKPMDSYRMDGWQNKKAKNAGMNHTGGVPVYFYLKDAPAEDADVVLSFHESDGTLIKSFSTRAKEKKEKLKLDAGGNQFVWDMRYPDTKKFEGMVLWAARTTGPKAVPGDYKVKLKVGDQEQLRDFKILKDPRSSSSLADMQEQFDFLRKVNGKVSEAHQAIVDIRTIRDQVKGITAGLGDNERTKPLIEKATLIDSLMTNVEQELYQTKNRSRQDPLNFPIKLTNKLGAVASLSSIGDFPPTKQAKAVAEEMTQKINTQLATFNQIKAEHIPAFNSLYKELAIEPISIKAQSKP
ncbi:MAG: glycosyl hydrolase [Bacteroidota bacterium]